MKIGDRYVNLISNEQAELRPWNKNGPCLRPYLEPDELRGYRTRISYQDFATNWEKVSDTVGAVIDKLDQSRMELEVELANFCITGKPSKRARALVKHLMVRWEL